MSLLRLERARKSYPAGLREQVVINDVSISIQEGEFVGVWGDRRSGKSTLLRIMAGIERPDMGMVLFEDQDLARLPADREAKLRRSGGIALVREWRPDRNRLTVDHIAQSLLCEGLTLRAARRLARMALERVGLSPCSDLPLQRLSRGELLRVGLAMAVVRAPRLLLVDEPAISPSPSERHELYTVLRELGDDRSTTVLIASEDPEALYGANRMLAIGGGRLRQTSEPGTVVEFPRRQASP